MGSVYAQAPGAADAGATVRMPLQDMFWGDRYGVVVDPFGVVWAISTHVRDVSPEELRRAGQRMAEEGAKRSS